MRAPSEKLPGTVAGRDSSICRVTLQDVSANASEPRSFSLNDDGGTKESQRICIRDRRARLSVLLVKSPPMNRSRSRCRRHGAKLLERNFVDAGLDMEVRARCAPRREKEKAFGETCQGEKKKRENRASRSRRDTAGTSAQPRQ